MEEGRSKRGRGTFVRRRRQSPANRQGPHLKTMKEFKIWFVNLDEAAVIWAKVHR